MMNDYRYHMKDKYTGEIFECDRLRPMFALAYERARTAVKANRSYHIHIYEGCKLVCTVGTTFFGDRRKLVITR